MTRFLDFLGRIFAIIPPPPRYASVLLDGDLRVSGYLIRRWPRVTIIGDDGCRFEIDPARVRLLALAPPGFITAGPELQ